MGSGVPMKDSKTAPVQPVRVGFNPYKEWVMWTFRNYGEWEAKMAKCKGKGKKKGK
jgi:predicted secreted acid phosphatase